MELEAAILAEVDSDAVFAKMTKDFEANDGSGMKLREGDELEVLDRSDETMWKVKEKETQAIGMVPADSVKIIPSDVEATDAHGLMEDALTAEEKAEREREEERRREEEQKKKEEEEEKRRLQAIEDKAEALKERLSSNIRRRLGNPSRKLSWRDGRSSCLLESTMEAAKARLEKLKSEMAEEERQRLEAERAEAAKLQLQKAMVDVDNDLGELQRRIAQLLEDAMLSEKLEEDIAAAKSLVEEKLTGQGRVIGEIRAAMEDLHNPDQYTRLKEALEKFDAWRPQITGEDELKMRQMNCWQNWRSSGS